MGNQVGVDFYPDGDTGVDSRQLLLMTLGFYGELKDIAGVLGLSHAETLNLAIRCLRELRMAKILDSQAFIAIVDSEGEINPILMSSPVSKGHEPLETDVWDGFDLTGIAGL